MTLKHILSTIAIVLVTNWLINSPILAFIMIWAVGVYLVHKFFVIVENESQTFSEGFKDMWGMYILGPFSLVLVFGILIFEPHFKEERARMAKALGLDKLNPPKIRNPFYWPEE